MQIPSRRAQRPCTSLSSSPRFSEIWPVSYRASGVKGHSNIGDLMATRPFSRQFSITQCTGAYIGIHCVALISLILLATQDIGPQELPCNNVCNIQHYPVCGERTQRGVGYRTDCTNRLTAIWVKGSAIEQWCGASWFVEGGYEGDVLLVVQEVCDSDGTVTDPGTQQHEETDPRLHFTALWMRCAHTHKVLRNTLTNIALSHQHRGE